MASGPPRFSPRSLVSLIGSMLAFLRDVNLSLAAVRLEIARD
jgi:hypothetical protein